MATISASPEVVGTSLRWPVRAPRRSAAVPDELVIAAPSGTVDDAFADTVAWRLLAAIVGVFLATIALSGVFARAASSAASLAAAPAPVVAVETGAHRAYTVNVGDTLWGIAERAAPQADPRATVGEIRALNGLSATHVLQAGDVLMLPDMP